MPMQTIGRTRGSTTKVWRNTSSRSLEARIIDGTLQPGERIVVDELCKTLSVSPTPVREAFQIMESRGFVIREPRKGISVARITRQEAQDIYKIRANIEGLAMSQAVQCQPPGLIEALKKLHEKMIRAAEKGTRCGLPTTEPEIPRTDRRLLRKPQADPADPGL